MKKFISIVLTLFFAVCFCASAFASDIGLCRYEPCPRCGQPILESKSYDPWVETGGIRPDPLRGEYYQEYEVKRYVRTYWYCSQTRNCSWRSNEAVEVEYAWRDLN